ncbi:MAG: hypothetical protein AB1486_06720 [Planctomycetota bacterium]
MSVILRISICKTGFSRFRWQPLSPAGLVLVLACAGPESEVLELEGLYREGRHEGGASSDRQYLEEIENPSQVALGLLADLRADPPQDPDLRLRAIVHLVVMATADPTPVVRAEAMSALVACLGAWRQGWHAEQQPHDPERATSSLRTIVATGDALRDRAAASPEVRDHDLEALSTLASLRIGGKAGQRTTLELLELFRVEAARRPEGAWRETFWRAARGLACHAAWLAFMEELGEDDLDARAAAGCQLLELDARAALGPVLEALSPPADLSPNPIRENEVRVRLLKKLAGRPLRADELGARERSQLAMLLESTNAAVLYHARIVAALLLDRSAGEAPEELARLLRGSGAAGGPPRGAGRDEHQGAAKEGGA